MTRQEAIEILKDDLEWAKQNKYPYIGEQKQEALNMAIEALKQEPCDDCISRQDAIEAFSDMRDGFPKTNGSVYTDISIVSVINDLPRATSKPGYWRPVTQGDEIIGYRCNNCGCNSKNNYEWNYCPSCGSRNINQEDDIPIEYFENGGI